MAALDDAKPLAPIAPDQPNRSRSWREFAALLAITCVAAVLRLFHLEQWSLSPVEAATWRAATMPLDAFYADPMSRSPLALLGLRWLLDTGWLSFHGEGWLRLPVAFVGTVTVPLLALVGTTWVERRTALVAALLLAVHPWHVIASQTAAVPVVVGGVGLLAFALLCRMAARGRPTPRRVLGGLALVVVAGMTGSGGWLVGASFAVAWLLAGGEPRWRRHRRVAAGLVVAVAIAVSLWRGEPSAVAPGPWAWLGGPDLPVVLAAVVGAIAWRASAGTRAADNLTFVRAAVLVPFAVTIGRWLLGADAAQGAMALLLPMLLLFAAHGVLAAVDATMAAFEVPSRFTRTVGAAALLTIATLLAVDSYLAVTVFGGNRAPWRIATDRVLDQLGGRAQLTVWAGEGESPLIYYLRPNHWRDAPRDAHPGTSVRSFAESDPLAVLAVAAAEAKGEVHLLVLRTDEVERLSADEATHDRLVSGFACLALVPCPLAGGDASIQVFRPLAVD